MILKSPHWKAEDFDLAPGYAALSELRRRRRRGPWAILLAAGAVTVTAAGGLAVVLLH